MRISDWSSDVCSSDLVGIVGIGRKAAQLEAGPGGLVRLLHQRVVAGAEDDLVESVIADDIELAVDGHGHARLADIRAVVVVPGVYDGARRRVDLQDAAIRVFDGEAEDGVGALAEGQTLEVDRKSTRLNSSHSCACRLTSSAGTKKSRQNN